MNALNVVITKMVSDVMSWKPLLYCTYEQTCIADHDALIPDGIGPENIDLHISASD